MHPSGCVMRWGTIFVGCNNPKIWNFRRQNLCSSSISEGENNILSKKRQMFWFIIWQRPFYDFLRIFVSFNCKIVVFWKWTGPLTVFFNLEENMILTTSRNVLCSRQRKPTKKIWIFFCGIRFLPDARRGSSVAERSWVSVSQPVTQCSPDCCCRGRHQDTNEKCSLHPKRRRPVRSWVFPPPFLVPRPLVDQQNNKFFQQFFIAFLPTMDTFHPFKYFVI